MVVRQAFHDVSASVERMNAATLPDVSRAELNIPRYRGAGRMQIC